MLVHHADAQPQRVAGVGDVLELAVDEDLAAVCGVEAVEDRHQRRLAGAILAHDAVDGAALDLEVDIAIGPNRPETLVDTLEFNGQIGNSAPGRALLHMR